MSPCTELKSKWMKDLNITTETLNLLEDTVAKNLEDIGVGREFMNKNQTAREILTRINNWDHVLLKSFCMSKEISSRVKRKPTNWEKNFSELPFRQRISV